MTKQTMFSTVLRGIRKQGGPSLSKDDTACAYRGENGRKCAAGWLLPNKHYNKNLEDQSLWSEPVIEAFEGAGFTRDEIEFMTVLQDAHDRAAFVINLSSLSSVRRSDEDFMPIFEKKMAAIAAQFGLQYNAHNA